MLCCVCVCVCFGFGAWVAEVGGVLLLMQDLCGLEDVGIIPRLGRNGKQSMNMQRHQRGVEESNDATLRKYLETDEEDLWRSWKMVGRDPGWKRQKKRMIRSCGNICRGDLLGRGIWNMHCGEFVTLE